MGERRDVHRVLVGKPERKRPLWRPRRRWEDNIQMDESIEITKNMQPFNRIYYSKIY